MEENSLRLHPMLRFNLSQKRLIVFAALALVLLVGGFIAWRVVSARITDPGLAAGATISASAFEEQYGLRVRLIGVTAGGGMIDFRLKVTDAEKASAFLLDPERVPKLIVPSSGVTIAGPPEPDHHARIENGSVYFLLLPNSGGAIQPGTPVIVSFGDVQLDEPIPAQ